jgi:hypothetical protein
MVNFYKEVIERLIARVHRVRLSFRKVFSGIFCTTMHWCILSVLSPSFWRNKGLPCYPIHPAPLTYGRLTFLFPELKTALKGTRFKTVSSIKQTVMRELKAISEEAFSQAFDSLYELCKHCSKEGGDDTECWY